MQPNEFSVIVTFIILGSIVAIVGIRAAQKARVARFRHDLCVKMIESGKV